MYLEYLSKSGVFIGKHVTRFGQELLERTSNYEIIKDGETRVKDLCVSYLASLISCLKPRLIQIRAEIQPVKEDIFQRKNSFNGMLNNNSQNEYMSSFLLALMSLLIDGEVNVEGICSQAVLAIFRPVTYNKRKL